jgi:glutamine amidotransferase
MIFPPPLRHLILMLALIDYGSGNIRSVHNALEHEGAEVKLVSSPNELDFASSVLLPGVGDFGDCVRGIKERGLWEPLHEWMKSGLPFLGICVGYQLLFEESEESPGTRGFGFFEGKVKRFSTPGLKVPQIGWNELEPTSTAHDLWSGLPEHPHVYFVHSYFPEPSDPSIVTSYCDYGQRFAASVARDNVAGVQFHPEKSQFVGLRILRNFIARDPQLAEATLTSPS